MALRDRLKMLERRAAGDEMLVIIVRGGLPGPTRIITAEAGEHHWAQQSDETESAFQARAVAMARAVGLRVVVIGGLPDAI